MRLLFITSNRIGDAILSTGLLGHLMETLDDPDITVACGPVAAPLFSGTPGVTYVHVMRKEKYSLHWLRLLRQTFGTRWDVVVDIRGSATAYALRAGRRYVLKPDHTKPRVEHIGGVMGLSPPPSPRLWPDEVTRARAAALLPSDKPILAVGPTANWPKKMWPVERYAEFVHAMTAPGGKLEGAHVLLTGGPGEQDQVAALYDAVPSERLIDQIGADLIDTYAQFERVSLFVGNDSGLMHLAAASGAPTLGLFGPTRDDLYAPWGDNSAYIRGDRSCDEITSDPAYDFDSPDSAMTDLSVDQVVQAASDLLDRVANK
jgi:lipopolysaccharide heptosyltransferase III